MNKHRISFDQEFHKTYWRLVFAVRGRFRTCLCLLRMKLYVDEVVAQVRQGLCCVDTQMSAIHPNC